MPVYTSEFVVDSAEYPPIKPSLNLNFAGSKSIGDGFQFTRLHSPAFIKVGCVNKAGLVEMLGAHQPRFEHDPLTRECIGLDFEQSVENLLTASININNALSSSTNVVFNSNTPDTPSPDGQFNANKVTDGTNNGVHHFSFTGSHASAATTTVSIWAKRGSAQTVRLHLSGGNNYGGQNPYIYCNLSTGQVTDYNATNVDAYGMIEYPNGWYRCWMTATSSGAEGTTFYIMPANNFQTYTGTGAFIYLWGPQLCRSWLGPYVETGWNGNNQVGVVGVDYLRHLNADDFYTPDGGTWIIEAQGPRNKAITGTNHHLIQLAPSSNLQDQSYQVRFDGATKPTTWGSLTSAVDQWNINTSNSNPNYVTGQLYKIGLRVKQNDVAFYVDGNQVGTDTSVSLREDIRKLQVGSTIDGSQPMSGAIRSIKFYPAHLSNAQLAHLTQA